MLLGFSSIEAKGEAEALWTAAEQEIRVLERPGGLEFRGGNLLYVVPAAPVAEMLARKRAASLGHAHTNGGLQAVAIGSRGPPTDAPCAGDAAPSAIDELVANSRGSAAVETLALVEMTELWHCAH